MSWMIPRRETNGGETMVCMERTAMRHMIIDDDDDVYDCIGERIKLEGETENMGVRTKEQEGMRAEVIDQ